MTKFKTKPDKAKFDVKIKTIDGVHKQYTNKFKKIQDSLPSKKSKLESIKKQLQKLEEREKDKFTIKDIRKRSSLKTEIQQLQKEIQGIENNDEELEYMYLTNDILVDYYENDNDNNRINDQAANARHKKRNTRNK